MIKPRTKACKNMKDDFEKFKDFICQTYSETDLTSVSELADELWEIVEDTTLPLSDVVACVECFEEKMKIKSECANFLSIMDEIIYLLEDNKENANRLYTFIVDNCELYSAIYKLLAYNSEYLTESQIQKLIPIVESQGFYWNPNLKFWSWY